MATLSLVNNFSDKINVLQQSSLENYSDQSTNKRQIIFLRTPTPTPVSETTKSKKQTSKTMTRIHNPPPVAVARRNARERNRVKQVNNGFATLRQHIPTNIASAYESGNGRGSNKKLSKVETLRMAVEYIKSLEKLLNLSEEHVNSSTLSISPNSSQFNSTYAYSTDDDDLHSHSPRNTLKKNGYQLMYEVEDEENIHPLKMEQMDLLQESNLQLSDFSIENNTSLSPEVYSEHSLSPDRGMDHESKSYIPVFNSTNVNVLPSFSQITYHERLPQVKSELLSPGSQQHQQHFNNEREDLKSEQRVCIITRNDTVNEHDAVIDVMWWDPAQQHQQTLQR